MDLEKIKTSLSPREEVHLGQGTPLLIPYRKVDKYGFCNVRKEMVVPCRYDLHRDVKPFSGGLGVVVKDGKFGFIDPDGYEVIPCKYVLARPFSEGLACVYDGRNWGFINAVGKLVIPFIYHATFGDFSDGMAPVHHDKGDLIGFINHAGETVVAFDYSSVACEFSEGLVCVNHWKGFSGYLNNRGETVIPMKYNHGCNFSNGLAKVSDNTKRYGYINQKDELVIPFYYHAAMDFSEGKACVRTGPAQHWGFIDQSGAMVIPATYSEVGNFSEGLARVQGQNGKWGFVDEEGQVAIPLIYDNARDFSEGIAAVKLNDHDDSWGAINRSGNTVLPFQYDFVFDFSGGVVYVNKNRKPGYVGVDGTEYFDDEVYMTVPVKNDSVPFQYSGSEGISAANRQAAINALIVREQVVDSTEERIRCAEEWINMFENRSECRRCLMAAEKKAEFMLRTVDIARAWYELLQDKDEAIRCVLKAAEKWPLEGKIYCRAVVMFFIHELGLPKVARTYQIDAQRRHSFHNRLEVRNFLKIWIEEFNDREQAVNTLKEHEREFPTKKEYRMMSYYWSEIMKDEAEAERCRKMADKLRAEGDHSL